MVKRLKPQIIKFLPKAFIPALPKFTLLNLIHDRGEDPWVIRWNNNYYYCREMDDCVIMVNKAARLEDIGKQNHVVWADPSHSSEAEVWAPELHRLDGKWYIYFTKDKEEKHRMYVLESTSDDPQGKYVFKGKITDPSDQWAIDGTILYHGDRYYFLWSGWDNVRDKTQNIYIAPMSNPWTISGERVCISRPEHDWEKVGAPEWPPVNEGPQALEKNGKIFIIYSASHSLTADYCLGQLALVGKDPLEASSWAKSPKPVFSKTGSIYGPGHASFIEKADGSDWIIYHAYHPRGIEGGWDARELRAQRFTWHKDGSPNFGRPRAFRDVTIFGYSQLPLDKLKIIKRTQAL